jgi:predicted nucleic acid-binding protein
LSILALLHVYFLVLEMFLWTRPLGLKTFRNTPEKAETTRVLAAAAVKAAHRMSYADCFAVATALERRVPLVTSDPEILGADIEGLQVMAIGGGAPGGRGA